MKQIWIGLMMAVVVAIGAAISQSVTISNAPSITQADLAAAVADFVTTGQLSTVQSLIPTKLGTVPIQPAGSGVVGSTNVFVPGDAAPALKVQRTTVTTDASGNWAVTWNWSFVSSTPTVNAIPLDNTGTFYACKVKTRSSAGATGSCSQITTNAVALISLTISLAPSAAPAGLSVMLIGAEPTQ